MPKYARVENNIVQEIIDFDPVGRFTQEIVDQFIECDELTKQGHRYNNGVFEEILPTTEELLEQQRQAILSELTELDKLITRDAENFYQALNIPLNFQRDGQLLSDVVSKKVELRNNLNNL